MLDKENTISDIARLNEKKSEVPVALPVSNT